MGINLSIQNWGQKNQPQLGFFQNVQVEDHEMPDLEEDVYEAR